MTIGLAFHCHHDILIEWVYDYEERLKVIRKQKPLEERELREALFHLLPDNQLPQTEARAEWDKARAEWDKARAEWDKADAEWDKARAEWDKADAEWKKARAEWKKARAEWDKARAAYLNSFDIEEFHRQSCHPNCPWDGETIFSQGTSVDILNTTTRKRG